MCDEDVERKRVPRENYLLCRFSFGEKKRKGRRSAAAVNKLDENTVVEDPVLATEPR